MEAKPLRILCVDDDRPWLELLLHFFRMHHFDAQGCTDGLEAWNLLSANLAAYDLVVTDNQMPRLSGLCLVRRLRNSGSPAKILMVCSQLHPDDKEVALALKVDGMLEKPVELHRLVAEVERLLGAHL